jgi:hypothetical protein
MGKEPSMLDWKPEIRRRLAGLKLETTREAAIVEEFAQYPEDRYAEMLSSGATLHCACRPNANPKTCRMCAVRV